MSEVNESVAIFSDGSEELAKPAVFVRSAFNYDTAMVSDDNGIECLDASLASQAEAEECDINTLVRRFGITGELPSNVRVPLTGEFAQVKDFHSAMNAIREAEAAFMEFPGEVRARFNHDPGALVDFVSDEANLEEARRLGVAVPAPVVPEVVPQAVRIVPDPSTGTV